MHRRRTTRRKRRRALVRTLRRMSRAALRSRPFPARWLRMVEAQVPEQAPEAQATPVQRAPPKPAFAVPRLSVPPAVTRQPAGLAWAPARARRTRAPPVHAAPPTLAR